MESYAGGKQNDIIKNMEEIEDLQKAVDELKAQNLELQCRNTDLERKALDEQRRDTVEKSKNECDSCKGLLLQLQIFIEEKYSLSKTVRRLEEEVQEWKRRYKSLEERKADKEQEHEIQQNYWKGKSTGRSRPLKDALNGDRIIKIEYSSTDESQASTSSNVRSFERGRSFQTQISEQENKELKEKVAALELQLSELKDVQKLLIEKGKQNEEWQKNVNDLKVHLDQEIYCRTSENKEQNQRWDGITKQLSPKTGCSGRFENFDDEFSNSNIARRLKQLYDDDWIRIFKTLERVFPQMNEYERIRKLSAIVKRCYWESTYLADTHTKQMFMITRKENGESPYDRQEVQEMLTHRRRFCQTEYVRTRVKTKVLEIVMSSKEVKHLLDLDNRKAINEKLESFCSNIIDGCWLIAISHPPMFLNFDVVGRLFKGLEQSWMEFSTKKPLEDMSKFEGTIAEVVWPSLELKDGTGLSMKGDAIVVKIGKTLKYPSRHGFIGFPNNNDESNRGKVYTFDI